MKSVVLFFLVFVSPFSPAFSQLEVNLKGVFYPNYVLDELGVGLEEGCLKCYESFNTIQITNLKNLFEIDSLMDKAVELNMFFTIHKIDTSVIASNGADTMHYSKGFIPELRVLPFFIYEEEDNVSESENFDHSANFNFAMKVKFLTDKKLSYELFIRRNCDWFSKGELIRFGTIKLKHRNPSKFKSYYGKTQGYYD